MKRNALLMGIGLMASACGGANNTQRNPAVDDFLTAAAQAQCDWEFRCCKDAEIKQMADGRFATAADCLPFVLLDIKNAVWLDRDSVNAGRTRVDSTNSAACLAELKTTACNLPNGQPPRKMMMMGIEPCTHVFVGAVPAGGECWLAQECVDGTRCVTGGGQARGVCVPLQRSGEICNTSSDCDQSAKSLFCNQKTFKCQPRAPLGGACAYTLDGAGNPTLPLTVECDTSGGVRVYCDPADLVCKSYPQDGEPCLAKNIPGVISRCDPNAIPSLTCDTGGGGNGVCRAPGKVGSDCSRIPCDPTLELYCDRNTQTCADLPSQGQSCAATMLCKQPSSCDFKSRTCVAPAQLGDSCQMTICDVLLYCDSMGTFTCKARLDDGTACTSSNQCLSNDCGFGPGGSRTCQPHAIATVCAGR